MAQLMHHSARINATSSKFCKLSSIVHANMGHPTDGGVMEDINPGSVMSLFWHESDTGRFMISVDSNGNLGSLIIRESWI